MSSAIHYFTELGYIVSVPLTDAQDYDLIVEIDDKLCKIQCKTTNYKNGTYFSAQLRTTGGNKSRYMNKNFDSTKVDYLFIYAGDFKKYLIPCNKITNVNSINLGKLYEEYEVHYN